MASFAASAGKFRLEFSKAEFKAIEKAMKTIGEKGARRAARAAARAAMRPVASAAKKLCPVDTGLLKKSIGTKSYFNKRNRTAVVIVGARMGFAQEINGKRRDPGKYGALVEYGNSDTGASPFLRPALESKRQQVEQIFRTKVLENIDKEIKKAATKK